MKRMSVSANEDSQHGSYIRIRVTAADSSHLGPTINLMMVTKVDKRPPTRVKGACRRQKPAFFKFIWVQRTVIGSKVVETNRKAGIGLRRESGRFPESKKLKPLF